MENHPPFDLLIQRYGTEIYAYLCRQLYDSTDAEDCFQDVFLRAFNAYPRLKAPANHRAWLYRIATNTASTFKKRRGRLAFKTEDLHPEIIQDGPTTAELVDRRLAFSKVIGAVERLPKKQRAALILRKYQGLSYEEIAQALTCSSDSARSNVYQALKKLRAELAPLENPPEGDDR
jgi:RNA polymerase sigma-70 factor (ECF subfamily)